MKMVKPTPPPPPQPARPKPVPTHVSGPIKEPVVIPKRVFSDFAAI